MHPARTGGWLLGRGRDAGLEGDGAGRDTKHGVQISSAYQNPSAASPLDGRAIKIIAPERSPPRECLAEGLTSRS
jgi:hypothetical protein